VIVAGTEKLRALPLFAADTDQREHTFDSLDDSPSASEDIA
jgi:hypothetical protein